MSGVGTFILGRPRPQTNHRRAESAAKWATPSSGKSPFRLGELFPRWANRVIARDDGVSPRERPGQDEAADWPAAAWSVVIEGLRQEDAASIEAVMQDWPEPHRGSGSNPQERQVCFSDVTRVAVEVRGSGRRFNVGRSGPSCGTTRVVSGAGSADGWPHWRLVSPVMVWGVG